MRIAICLTTLLAACTNAAALDLRDLEGKSIVATYTEQVSGPRGTFRSVWRDKIYVSTKGRIFQKFNFTSESGRMYGVAQENVSGETRRAFRFNGSGLERTFANPRTGIQIRYAIEFSGAAIGAPCHISISRSGGWLQFSELGQSCVIVQGNILGR